MSRAGHRAGRPCGPEKKPADSVSPRSEPGRWISHRELADLTGQLEEAQGTIEAIQSGAVDAVVVNGAGGSQVYSLAGAEQRFRIYVEQMQEGAITALDDGVVLYCNRRFAEMVELPLERVIGRSISTYLQPEVWAQLSLVFTEDREFVKQESTVQRANLTGLAVHFTASRLPAIDQKIMCIVVTDLTEQKSRQELKLAKEVAEKSNRAKDAFLAALSHELRTPLTPVLMAATALEQNEMLPAHVQRDLAMIRRNIELEARLIDDLLDLTRIASGKLELRIAPMDVHAAIRSALTVCQAEIENKHHNLEVRLEARHTTTTGDAIRFQQALWNLIRNAIKFTPARGHVSVRTWNLPGAVVCVEVRDSGIGFAPGDAQKLFDPFEQGGREITRQFGGLGLGLAISKSIIESHGGTLSAESRGANMGAAFAIQFPLELDRSAATRTRMAAHAPDPLRGAPRLRILLVEDHKDTRATLMRYLQAARNEVMAAGTAAEALEMAAKTKFDLVISDLGLPDDGGGLAMMRLMRDRHGLKGIAVSGYGMDEDIAQSKAAGFTHHLAKPFSLERLKHLIDNLAGRC